VLILFDLFGNILGPYSIRFNSDFQGKLEELEEKAANLASLPTSELLGLAGLSATEKLPSMHCICKVFL
jgi:hypothetical protein